MPMHMAACRPGKVKLAKEYVEQSMVNAHNNEPSHALAYFSRACLGKHANVCGCMQPQQVAYFSPIFWATWPSKGGNITPMREFACSPMR